MKKLLSITALFIAALLIFSACFNADVQNGKSAYELAVENGFEGSLDEWLNSLKGIDGADGRDGKNALDGQSETQEAELTIQYNLRSVVGINASSNENFSSGASGSGVIYSVNGSRAVILTNYHMVYDKNDTVDRIYDYIDIFLYGMDYADFGTKYAVSAEVLGYFAERDLALLSVNDQRIASNDITPALFGDSNLIRMGQIAYALGNSMGKGIQSSMGIISRVSNYITINSDWGGSLTYRAIRFDTPINHGNSGGGLFSANGECIGITSAGIESSDANSMAYAIPSNVADGWARAFLENGNKKAVLGISTSADDISIEYQPETGTTLAKQKIVIKSVTENSLAYNNLQIEDVLVSATLTGHNTVEIINNYVFADYLFKARTGDILTIKYLRNDEQYTAVITITQQSMTALS